MKPLRLPNCLAAWRRDMAEGLRLLPSVIREMFLQGEALRILADRARASAQFWQENTGALWMMGATILMLWIIGLAVFAVFALT